MRLRSTAPRIHPLGWLLALAALALWSCSTPEASYEVLSFFFDGVPLPPSMRTTAVDEEGHPVALSVMVHDPYAAGRCVDCHGEVGQFTMSLSGYSGVTSQVCLKCHEDVAHEYPVMHGPVASADCLACHEPHESLNAHLLIEPTPKLCLQCHAADDLRAAGTPQHEDLSKDCLACHHGHGGLDRNLLRIDLSPPAPPEPQPVESVSEGGP